MSTLVCIASSLPSHIIIRLYQGLLFAERSGWLTSPLPCYSHTTRVVILGWNKEAEMR